jgi:cytoskeletal protein RodZ
MQKKEKIGKLKKKSNSEKKNSEKKSKNQQKKKKKEKALWITVVIHSVFGCGGTVISLFNSVIIVNQC